VRRLPSVYDAVTRTANGDIPVNHQSSNIPPPVRLPVGGTPDPPSTPAAQDPTRGEEAPAIVNEQPPQLPTASIEQETLQVPSRPTPESGPQQSGESLVESSVLLQVSIVNRSSENLPISLQNNDHSTLEYVEFVETASYRQYSFTSEHLAVPDGFLRRSTSGLRRMLSARNRFIAARSRSFLRRLQREVDIEMQNPDDAWQEPNNQPGGPAELDGVPSCMSCRSLITELLI